MNLNCELSEIVHLATQAILSDDENVKRLALGDIYHAIACILPVDHGGGEKPRKHTMDFGHFHVTRAAIRGRTILTFRRKQEVDEQHGSLIPGRIIVADIHEADVGRERPVVKYIVKSYEPGQKPRVLYAGDAWVSLSKVEKIVYKMVKCDIKETQRRRRSRKRAAAKRAAALSPSAELAATIARQQGEDDLAQRLENA